MACDRQIRYAATNVINIDSTEFNTKEFFMGLDCMSIHIIYNKNICLFKETMH